MSQKTISIGNVRVRLCSSHAGFWSCADRFYEGYFVADDGQFDDTIDVSVLPGDPVLTSEDSVVTAALTTRCNGKSELVYPFGVAEWDRRRRCARVRLADWDYHRGAPSPEIVCHSLVSNIVAHRLLERQGCLVHAASLIRQHKGYLFVGPSGAGKSTIARLSASTCSVLGDETSLVAQIGGEFRILGTPFLRQFQSAAATDSAPLVAICFLYQAPRNALRTIPKSRAVWELTRSIRHTGQCQTAARALLEMAERICDQIPCYKLEFLPDASFWSCFDD